MTSTQNEGAGAAVEARGLTRRHGGRTVVDQVSFVVRPGRVTGFLGPNGAGKSTDVPGGPDLAGEAQRVIVGWDRIIPMRIIGGALREPLAPRTWRELLYSLASLPLAVLGMLFVLLSAVLGLLSAGIVLFPLLPLFLTQIRGLAKLQRGLALGLLRLRVDEPPRRPRGPGVLGFLTHHLADPSTWRAVGYCTLRFPLGLGEFLLGFAWWGYGLSLLLRPVLAPLQAALSVRPGPVTDGRSVGGWFAVSAVGLLMLLAWPWVQRGPVLADRWLMARLLGPSATSLRLAQLTETREHAVNEAAATLRRIERDLHDGAQARLIALGMRLGRAETRLGKGDTELALELVRASREETKEIVQELRELVRSIHPPALDAGLEPALTTLAARSALPTTVRVELDRRPAASVETMLYFATAELLTNAAKHSGAGAVAVTLLGAGEGLRLLVTDDGRGGAVLSGAGSGLRGLAERVRTVDGQMSVDSPPGGPTTVQIEMGSR